MCIFCDFISGKKKKHSNGFKFVKLNETEHTISFLSIDFPKPVDGHLLVIPKKHYEFLEDVPKYILNDLISHLKKSLKVIRKDFPACNVLLNNGKESGQTIFHTHFHVIPRRDSDGIEIESWPRKKMKEASFNNLVKKLKNDFKSLS